MLGCLADPSPRGCPIGIRGVIDLTGLASATAPPRSLDDIRFLFADLIAPGTYRLVMESPPDSSTDLWYWTTDRSALQAAQIDTALLDGKLVSVATVTLDPSLDFSFVATVEGDGLRAFSTVGSLDVKS